MAGSKSDYLENKVLDHALGTTSFTMPSDVYVGLYTVAPTDAGGGTEVSGNAYARELVYFASAASGATSNNAEVEFSTPTGSWGTVVAFGIFDNISGGNLLYWGDLTQNKTIDTGDVVKFLVGDIDITES